MDKYSALKKYFGYESFRGGQEKLVDAILDGRDTLGIMPTGAGKSICFQVPALLLDGITLVISPLISLMKDQVSALVQAGVPAAFINTSLTYQQTRLALENARRGKYRIIYVAPERLMTEEFLAFSASVKLAMIAVDEAHCVSQWGQNFRPSYLKIREFSDTLTYRPVMSAFTATATDVVKRDIIKILRLEKPVEVITGFDRKNLTFNVLSPHDRYSALLKILKTKGEQSGIVYCSTRKTVEELCSKLNSDGYPATRYHAGLSDAERAENQELFICDTKRIMIATNAFGMGIDKSNVSYVVHYNMPKNIESYYQEAGRAGRDGSPAECTLFYNGQDYITAKFLIEQSDSENTELDAVTRARVRRLDLKRLNDMVGYCKATGCLRAYILRYFGEAPETENCGNCSSCCGNTEITEVTVEAQKILSCIKRMDERFGVKMVCDVLRGSSAERILSMKLNELSTYGIMSDCSESRLKSIIDSLEKDGFITKTDDEFPVLKLSPSAADILFRKKAVFARLRIDDALTDRKKAVPDKTETADYETDEALFKRLCTLRKEIAAVQGVPAYIIFTDSTLREMSGRKPLTERDMLEISGVGSLKMERYGKRFLKAIKENL